MLEELKRENETAYSILNLLVQNKARTMTANLPRWRNMGLERVIEIIEGRLENGTAHVVSDNEVVGIIFDEELDDE